MKFLSILLIIAAAMLTGCGSVANNATNANNANLRGTNTNTGYVMNANSNVKPTVPPDATNLTPGNVTGNSNGNSNMKANSNSNNNGKR